MSTTRPTPDRPRLDDAPLPVRARLAAAWTSFMFLYLYVDYLAFYKTGFLDELLAGRVHEFDIGPAFVGSALTLVAVPSVMVVVSAVLPARVNRAVNLVVAVLLVPVTVYNAAGESWSYAYYYGLSIGLELLLLAYVLRAAWTWPRPTPVADDEPARVPQRA